MSDFHPHSVLEEEVSSLSLTNPCADTCTNAIHPPTCTRVSTEVQTRRTLSQTGAVAAPATGRHVSGRSGHASTTPPGDLSPTGLRHQPAPAPHSMLTAGLYALCIAIATETPTTSHSIAALCSVAQNSPEAPQILDDSLVGSPSTCQGTITPTNTTTTTQPVGCTAIVLLLGASVHIPPESDPILN